ncbi:hypothetical protein NXS19_006082 [Fusarium pseudograminearum]|nr:hypothetical protein NXS19_006082 [Fusarium pseudograminearum]
MEPQSDTKITHLLFFKSLSGKTHTLNISISEGEDPEAFALSLAKAFKLHFNGFKRVLYRGILLKKPVVSLVKFSQITDTHPIDGGENRIFIQEEVLNHTLTAALRKPSILRGVERGRFYQGYSHTIVGTDGTVPEAAILIHFVTDPSALTMVRIIATVISVGIGLGGDFGLSL